MSTKEKIFETALELFSKNGFNATSIRMITKKTGISVASFYNHFESKDELLQKIYDHYMELFVKPSEAFVNYDKLLDQLGPEKLFVHLTRSFIESSKNEELTKLSKVIVMEQYTSKTAGEIVYRDKQKLLSLMEDLFVLMHEKGLIAIEDPKATGKLIGYAFLGFASQTISYDPKEESKLSSFIENQMNLIIKFIKEIII